MDNLLKHISESKDQLPKRQRVFCDYILRNPLKASMLSITDLANEAGIGSATVVRSINSLGYQSVNRFKSELRQCAFSESVSTYNTFWSTTQQYAAENDNIANAINSFSDYIKNLNSPVFIEQLNTAAQMILSARYVYILGLRSSRVFSVLLENELRLLHIPYIQLSEQADLIFDKLADITKQDLLFTIAASPTATQSADAMRICHKMGVPSVLLSLTQSDSIAKYASCLIDTECFGMSTVYSPLVFSIELIRILLQQQIGAQFKEHSQRQDQFFKEHGLKIWNLDS